MIRALIIPTDRTERDAICDPCVRDKNRAAMTGRAPWARINGIDEGYEDVTVHITLPLGDDEGIAECPYGHRHLVVRDQSPAEIAFR